MVSLLIMLDRPAGGKKLGVGGLKVIFIMLHPLRSTTSHEMEIEKTKAKEQKQKAKGNITSKITLLEGTTSSSYS